jgi:HEPN domain-containing protein
VVDLDACAARAHELTTFANGLDDAGMHDSARRLRLSSYDVVELVEELRAEQSGRRAMQANYERALDVLTTRACETCLRAARAVEEAVDG